MATPLNCVKDVTMLTEPEIETRAASDAPFFKIEVDVKGKEYLCYESSDNHGLMYPPPKTDNCKSSSVVMKMVKLEKQGDSDQHGYVITNPVVKDTYLKVMTDETFGSKKKRAVRFDKKSEEMFYQSQLFKLCKNTDSETKFALYTTAINSKGNIVTYYLKPESGTIVAEESSSPDNCYCFSFGVEQVTYGPALTASQLAQLLLQNGSVQIVIQLGSGFFLKTDTRNKTLFDDSLFFTDTEPIPLSCKLTFTSAGGGDVQPSTFTCTSQVLNLHHLHTTNSAVMFHKVSRPPTFQFEAISRSSNDRQTIICELGHQNTTGRQNNYLTLGNDPLKNVTATTEKRLATSFVIHQVLA